MNVLTELQKDSVTFWSTVISGLFLLTSFVIVGIFFTHLPPFLPLYNKMPWGYERLGTRIDIFIPLGVSFCFFIANSIINPKVYTIAPLLGRLLSTTTTLITFLQCFFVIQLIRFIL